MTQLELISAKPAPKSFEQDAYSFLVAFAHRRCGHSFSAEHVTLAAQKKGIVAPDMRNWGPIFRAVAADGHIRRSDVLFPRSMGNGSLSPGWTEK